MTQAGCLAANADCMLALLREWKPQVCAVESVIYVQSYRTAITLGAARGSALVPIAQAGLPIHQYPPKRVKQAIVGRGAATKEQVAFMVRARLGLTTTPDHDAADALAIALAHSQAVSSPAGQLGELL